MNDAHITEFYDIENSAYRIQIRAPVNFLHHMEREDYATYQQAMKALRDVFARPCKHPSTTLIVDAEGVECSLCEKRWPDLDTCPPTHVLGYPIEKIIHLIDTAMTEGKM